MTVPLTSNASTEYFNPVLTLPSLPVNFRDALISVPKSITKTAD
ncbi:hypothetical protein [Morganella morganii IS15]|nr:hypothetical protein [Morganella morganii IS15]